MGELGWGVAAPRRPDVSVDVWKAQEDLHTGAAALVDVRTRTEFSIGHAPSALSAPLQELAQRAEELPSTIPLYIICHSGQRSSVAARYLAERGLTVANVKGGMVAWERAGLPVERSTQGRSGLWALLRRG